MLNSTVAFLCDNFKYTGDRKDNRTSQPHETHTAVNVSQSDE